MRPEAFAGGKKSVYCSLRVCERHQREWIKRAPRRKRNFTHENHLAFQSAGLRGCAPTAVDLAFITITRQRCITEDKLMANANYIFTAHIVLNSKIQTKRVPRNRSLGINLSRTFDAAGVLHLWWDQSLGQITMCLEMSYAGVQCQRTAPRSRWSSVAAKDRRRRPGSQMPAEQVRCRPVDRVDCLASPRTVRAQLPTRTLDVSARTLATPTLVSLQALTWRQKRSGSLLWSL